MKKVLCIFSKPKDFAHPENYPAPVTFFGYIELAADKDFVTERLEVDRKPGLKWALQNPLWVLWRPFELFLYRLTGVGFSLGQIAQRIRYINTFDVVYGINDTSGLPLSFLKRVGIIRPRVVFISAGLINNLYARPRDIRTKFIHYALAGADRVLAWSPHEQNMFATWGVHSETIPLEADITFFQPDANVPKEDFILFSGRDVGRDTDTLINVLKETHLPAVFITNQSLLPKGSLPENITLITEFIDHDTLKDYYHGAKLVVVPVKEIGRISGQTSILESLAMGKATVVAKTKACVSAYPELTEGKHLLWYEPENEESLRKQILRVYNNTELCSTLETGGRTFVESLPKNWLYSKLKETITAV